MFGWPTGRGMLLALNVGAIVYIWWRLSRLAELKGIRRWLLLVFFTSWLSTGLVVGLGNLVLVCLAAMLAAYPFKSAGQAVALALSAMKHSIVFPVYFQLLLKNPRILVIPSVIFAVCGAGAMAWARLGPAETLAMARSAAEAVGTWGQHDHTTLRHLMSLFTANQPMVTLANWGVWLALFVTVVRCVKDPLANLAAMMLLSLLPLYHNIYDMVVAAPLLAVLLRRGSLAWPALMTLALATNLFAPLAQISPAFGVLEKAYYPLLILAGLGLLIFIDRKHRVAL
jgi:hypothetical protein